MKRDLLHRDRPQGGRRSGKVFRIALAGNPNAGKTSLFNALTGQHQHIGNYPGVTVEKKIGFFNTQDISLEITDLPGTYSLTAYSIEEVVARDFVMYEQPDLIVDVIDSTNIERNLYLLLQFRELGVPVVGVLNMMDEAEEKGIQIDHEQLGTILGIPFVKTVGHRGTGVQELVDLLLSLARGEETIEGRPVNYGRELEGQREDLVAELALDPSFSSQFSLDWMAIKLLEEDEDAIAKVKGSHFQAEQIIEHAARARTWIKRHFNEEAGVVVAEQRYAYIHGAVRETVKKKRPRHRITTTERIDRIALNRFGGLFVFFAMMFLVYQFTFAIGNPLSDLIDAGFGALGQLVTTLLPASLLRDLVVDGIIGGVGGVLVFFPLVMLLFFGLAFLEDTGYMARAAFVMDHFFHLFGLHGRSFIPFMIATGCAVPAVMSARTLVNPRDRIITVLVTPLLMCGAKSPVIAMLAAAFFPEKSALIFWLVWLAGWLIAFTIALVFRRTLFKGEAAPFVMELPPYRMPTFRAMVQHMWERGVLYLRKAGTIILAASIVLWFLLNFPQRTADTLPVSDPQMAQVEQTVAVDTAMDENKALQDDLVYSYAGRIGHAMEPILRPAGFDWKIGVALLSGAAAKEVIVSTMGIVYGVGEADPDQEASAERAPLRERIASDPTYSRATALALMFFVLIYFPCIATLAVVKKELGSWKWSAFLAVYTVIVAWALAVTVYQTGVLFGLGA
ncbi:ferrous iron transport protein B [bacterium]|nr:ferrous iron transport protein B [bacterium]